MADTIPIPQPKPHLLVGNAPELSSEATGIESMMKLGREYGPIVRVQLPTQEMIMVNSQELVNELCDEKRFDKRVHAVINHQRDNAGDNLFTAHTQEANWGLAHRILMPGFGAPSLRRMYPGMVDIAEQLLLMWERQPDGSRIDLADNMTRLTLDTIALCAYSYRFNSFYSKEPHPYVAAMVRVLVESGARAIRPQFMTRLMVWKARQRAEDIRLMHRIGQELIDRRRKDGPHTESKDLLDLMLWGKDPQTGQGLSDENIGFQMVGFLTAGHETTSGLLTFALYELLQKPETLAKARAEVDRVLGTEMCRFEQISQLTYIDQVLKETLRLWPTAPAFAVYPYEKETVIGGKYLVRNEDTLFIFIPMLHRDPKVWGPDADSFDPERLSPERFAKLPPNSWKPFGNGQRSCIGRPFALQESTLVLASILQRFDISMADPGYKLKIKQTLTIKPDGFFIKAKRRNVTITSSKPITQVDQQAGPAPERASDLPLRVLFGSNGGSAEAFAQRIASDAKVQGYVATIAALDSAVGHLPREGAVVIVAASYEGQPTDNARQFVAWTDGLTPGSLKGVKYAIFGCGNRDWTRTYQAVPRRIEAKLNEAGAEPILERGEADARGDFFGDFDRWYKPFWQKVGAAVGQATREAGPAPRLKLEFVEGARTPLLRANSLQLGEVVENRELVDMTSPMGRSKRHIEIALPKGAHYRTGDYLSVLASNPPENIGRALRRFGLSYDAQVVLQASPGMQTFFPTGQPVLAGELLASFVELGLPATRQQIEQLAISTANPAEKIVLEEWATNSELHAKDILEKRQSVLDLLEQFPSCQLPFITFLEMLTPLKPRQYSISSSPLWSEEHCTITVALVEAPAWSGKGIYRGVASTYLAHARPGMKVAVTTRPSQSAFHPPDSLTTPIIMVGAGTGMAPFRGFLQDRAIRAATEGPAGEGLLFFGCDHPDVDLLYKDELAQWEKQGLVKLRPAYCFAPDGDVKFVQHRLWKDRAEVMALMEKGARIYVCGDGKRMAPAVRESFGKMHQEITGCTPEQGEAWLAELEHSIRYSQDIFA